jgi:histidinol dehydrogenase
MECELLVDVGDPVALATELRSLVPDSESVAGEVAAIISAVVSGGDVAVRSYVERHDTGGAPAPEVRVSEAEVDLAMAELSDELRAGLQSAIANVRRVAEASVNAPRSIDFEHHRVILREAPVRRAAVYVPGGRAPYPSTVVMGVVTARAAGVEEVAVCTSPGAGGIHPAVLAACRLAGASEIYRMGGAHGVAALALGTATIEPVDVIVGPGNLYVQEAKRQLSGRIGIDSFAGPSELLVLADPGQELDPIALDLLAQAEHGTGTLVIAASSSRELLDGIALRLAAAPATGAVGRVIELATTEQALALSEAFAPEHLELIGPQVEALAARVTRAGCVFVGVASGTAFGDYIAGSNHTLPTAGAARFASALSTVHFRRRFAEVRIDDGSSLARLAAPIARAEGFELHARSMEARIRDH